MRGEGYKAIYEAVRWIWTDNYRPIRTDVAIQAARIGSALDVGENLRLILERIGATVDAEKLAEDSQFAKRWWILARAHQKLSHFDYLVIRLAFGRAMANTIKSAELTHPLRAVYYELCEAVEAHTLSLSSRKSRSEIEEVLELIEKFDQTFTEYTVVTLPVEEGKTVSELCSEIQVNYLLR